MTQSVDTRSVDTNLRAVDSQSVVTWLEVTRSIVTVLVTWSMGTRTWLAVGDQAVVMTQAK